MNVTNTDAIRDPQSTSQPFLDDSEGQSGAAAGAYLREQCTEPVDDIFEPGATAANATPSDTLKFELVGDLLPAAACAIELFPADGDVLRKLSNADKDPSTAASKKARILKNLQSVPRQPLWHRLGVEV